MLCDELKRFDIVGKYRDEETMYEFIPDGVCYDADEVDAAIAELKEFAENACIERDDNQTAIDELNAENRRLKRALYKACANWACAKMEYEQFDSNMFMCGFITDKEVSWKSMMKKCRAKAEEYK